MDNSQSILEKLKSYKQEHIINFLEKIDIVKRKNLIEQLEKIDFNQLQELYKNTQKEIKIKENKIESIQ